MASIEDAQEYLTAVAEQHLGELKNLKDRNAQLEAERDNLIAERDEAVALARDERGKRDIAAGEMGVAQDALEAFKAEATEQINALHQTNQMLADRDRESRDEHKRLRAIITAQNTKGSK